jgi:hypothetical protein
MTTQQQINNYLQSQPPAIRQDMEQLHQLIQKLIPAGPLSFLDGKNAQGKIVSNPNIGYGQYSMVYANGDTREFYQVGQSANTTGISVYIMGIKDRNYLPSTYGKTIGKASVTGYCIKFKALKDIDLDQLIAAIKDGLKESGGKGAVVKKK